MPSPSDLTYFVEVALTQNLSRAAERLGISQPSLTLAIQRLEHSIGTSVFVRSKKGVTLTQAGKQLLSHSRNLLESWESVKSRALASTSTVQGSFSLGCHPSVALYTLRHFMPELMENYPDVEIKLVHDLSRNITESVIRMALDLGIVVNPVKHPDLVIRKLFTDEVTMWVGKGERPTQDPRSGEAVLVCDANLIQTQGILKKIKNSSIKYKRVLTSSNLEVVTELTVSGAGIGIIPGRVAAMENSKELRRLPKAPIFSDEICLLYRTENRSVRSIQVMAQMILSSLQS